ncbi:hypothetical protein SSBR45G_39500 [Bradyrhizobium sp. SSBR45G]|nr:hypothetical protein SSBR45G_39500 [Bradyrhizobium sp. SSBR45G]
MTQCQFLKRNRDELCEHVVNVALSRKDCRSAFARQPSEDASLRHALLAALALALLLAAVLVVPCAL